MKTTELFPVVDPVSHQEMIALGVTKQREVRARWTGEKRQPKQGEWYLSGAIVEAYRAPNDLSSSFHIARLVTRGPYQPKTGQKCGCKPGQQRDNCPTCEGTGMVVDFAAIRARRVQS